MAQQNYAAAYPARTENLSSETRFCRVLSFESFQSFSIGIEEEVVAARERIAASNTVCAQLPSVREVAAADGAFVAVGRPCFIRSQDDWNRCEVTGVAADGERVDVRFVDFGDSERGVVLDELKPLPLRFADYAPLAIDCKEMERTDDRLPEAVEANSGRASVMFVERDAQTLIYKVYIEFFNAAPAGGSSAPVGMPFATNNSLSSLKSQFKRTPSSGKLSTKLLSRFDEAPCRVDRVLANCAVLVPRAGGGGGGNPRVQQLQLTTNETTLDYGPLAVHDLTRIMSAGDVFPTIGAVHLLAGRRPTANEVYAEDAEWVALNISQRGGGGREFLTHATATAVRSSDADLYARGRDIVIHADVRAFKNAGLPVSDLTQHLQVHQTTVVRVRFVGGGGGGGGASADAKSGAVCEYEAVAVELLEVLPGNGYIYVVTEQYAVIIYMSEVADENHPFRYVFAPTFVIESAGVAKDDWYGRQVDFAACSDQPIFDQEGGQRRWKAVRAVISADKPRGNFRYKGVWQALPYDDGEKWTRSAGKPPPPSRPSSPSDAELILQPSVLREWQRVAESNDETARVRPPSLADEQDMFELNDELDPELARIMPNEEAASAVSSALRCVRGGTDSLVQPLPTSALDSCYTDGAVSRNRMERARQPSTPAKTDPIERWFAESVKEDAEYMRAIDESRRLAEREERSASTVGVGESVQQQPAVAAVAPTVAAESNLENWDSRAAGLATADDFDEQQLNRAVEESRRLAETNEMAARQMSKHDEEQLNRAIALSLGQDAPPPPPPPPPPPGVVAAIPPPPQPMAEPTFDLLGDLVAPPPTCLVDAPLPPQRAPPPVAAPTTVALDDDDSWMYLPLEPPVQSSPVDVSSPVIGAVNGVAEADEYAELKADLAAMCARGERADLLKHVDAIRCYFPNKVAVVERIVAELDANQN